MNNNITYEVVKKEIEKMIINYLYQDNEITINEYDTLMSKCDNKINDLKKEIEKKQDNYKHNIKVDIKI